MSENNNKQKRKRVCPHCGRKLWMREFYPLKNGGRSSWCHECVLVYKKREQYRKHRKVADGTFMHRTLGRLVEHKGYSTRIFWNGNMLSIMRRHYHNTLNRSWLKCSVFPNAASPGRPERWDWKRTKVFCSLPS